MDKTNKRDWATFYQQQWDKFYQWLTDNADDIQMATANMDFINKNPNKLDFYPLKHVSKERIENAHGWFFNINKGIAHIHHHCTYPIEKYIIIDSMDDVAVFTYKFE